MEKGSGIHLIGIGGIGMSAIAKVLIEEGYQVSGSDLKLSPITDALVRMGATVYKGHSAENVGEAQLVVVSSAIQPDNVEATEAERCGIPVVKRGWMLGQMMRDRYGIAVAGSHGKTTIAAMIAFLLTEAGLDPNFVVGGILKNLGTNAKAGKGRHFVVEADEYDRTFLGLKPNIAIVTNIEMDHPDCYPSIDEMMVAFREFVALVPKDGCIIGCGDEGIVKGILGEFKGTSGPEVITYGLGEGADWRAVDIRPNEGGGNDFVALHDERAVGGFSLQIPGIHNVANGTAALAVADRLDFDLASINGILQRFRGVKRRFDVKGEVGGITVIDDYAHHPTQIRTTLATARERYPNREVWAVFQPHTYSRTKALLDDFAASFTDADHVVVSDIYAAREFDDLGVSAVDIVARMEYPDARYIADLDDIVAYLLPRLRPSDVLITLAAGDGYRVGEEVLKKRALRQQR